MLDTAANHFYQDIERAKQMLHHADGQAACTLKDDLIRASWMMAVGACDAYFSDAYADLVSRALRAKEIEPAIEVPNKINNLKVPAITVIRPKSDGWRWRMAARELIEEENVLSLEKIRSLFNHFLPKEKKLINQGSIGEWIIHRDSRQRLFGLTAAQYSAKNPQQKGVSRKDALDKFHKRYQELFQRRHDCIHNCDRPKIAPQDISVTSANKTIQDIEFLVIRCNETLVAEFSGYLRRLGFNAVTRNRVGA